MKIIKECILHINPDNTRYLDVLPDQSCGNCKGCGMCDIYDDKIYQVPLNTSGEYKDNQRVKAEITLPSQAISALLIFGQLLALTLIGGAVGNYIMESAGLIIGGITGISSGFGLVYLLQKKFLRISARIIDKI